MKPKPLVTLNLWGGGGRNGQVRWWPRGEASGGPDGGGRRGLIARGGPALTHHLTVPVVLAAMVATVRVEPARSESRAVEPESACMRGGRACQQAAGARGRKGGAGAACGAAQRRHQD